MFNLAALGAGLGQFAQDYRQQQEAAIRQQQFQLQLQRFAQEQREQQQRQQAAAGLFGLAKSGAFGGMQPMQQMPSVGPTSAPDMGGGLRAGGALTGDPLDLIAKYESGGRNIPQGIVGPQGGYNPSVGRVTGPSSAGGPWQIIDPTWRKWAPNAGVDINQYPTALSAPVEVQRKVAQYGYDTEGFKPWAPYNSRLAAAIRGGTSASADLATAGGDFSMPSYGEPQGAPDTVVAQPQQAPTATLASAVAPKGGQIGAVGEGASAKLVDMGSGAPVGGQSGTQQANPMAQVHQQVQSGVQRTAQITPPQVYGRMGLDGLAKQIEAANPDAPPEVKMMILEGAQKLLAPDANRQWELYKEQHKEAFEKEMALFRKNLDVESGIASDKRALAREKELAEFRNQLPSKEAEVFEDESGSQHYLPKGQPIPPGWRKWSATANKIGKPTALEVTKEDGSVERVQAQQQPDGQWVTADERRQPIDTSRGYTVIPASAANALGGGRDSVQRDRQLVAGREVISDLQNVVALPITTTGGWFQGRKQGPGLLDALKENMAETLTSEDAELANSALAGLERELSIIVSPVYGGKWAADSFNSLRLKEGQTNLVKLYNIARMRQTADNALEAIATSNRIGREQKEYAKQMRKMLDEAVPWTPADVTAFRSKSQEGQSFRDFAKIGGVTGAADGTRGAEQSNAAQPAAPEWAKGTPYEGPGPDGRTTRIYWDGTGWFTADHKPYEWGGKQ